MIGIELITNMLHFQGVTGMGTRKNFIFAFIMLFTALSLSVLKAEKTIEKEFAREIAFEGGVNSFWKI